jgi:hypothetical protein
VGGARYHEVLDGRYSEKHKPYTALIKFKISVTNIVAYLLVVIKNAWLWVKALTIPKVYPKTLIILMF